MIDPIYVVPNVMEYCERQATEYEARREAAYQVADSVLPNVRYADQLIELGRQAGARADAFRCVQGYLCSFQPKLLHGNAVPRGMESA